MKYKPITAVWEITMKCNMRCKHCGSTCEDRLPDELTTEEALNLCDDLGRMGLEYITLSGGEPTTREDWHLIAKRLRENGVAPNIITNGWNLDEEVAEKAKEAGISTVAISIDGLHDTHDFIRRKGSFERSMKAFEILNEKGIWTSAITTINKKNIDELPQLKEVLIEKGVNSWQLQIGLPMGNLEKNSDLVIDPEEVDNIIDFAYENIKDNRIRIAFGDCVGYYSFKAIEVRKAADPNSNYYWKGCAAGKRSMGILQNGDILACTSIRDKEFVEGNIRNIPLEELWNREDAFKWNREMKKSKLKGICSKCNYGDICLGGCSNTRLCMEKDIYGENKYCSYNVAVKKQREKIQEFNEADSLYETAHAMIENKQLQIAELLLERAIQLKSDDIKSLNLYGFVNFMIGNYEASKEINEKVLKIDPENAYANKGLGLCLCKLGDLAQGFMHLRIAMNNCDTSYMDPYYDCAVMFLENDRKDEAVKVLKEAKEKSEEFYENNKELYEKLEVV